MIKTDERPDRRRRRLVQGVVAAAVVAGGLAVGQLPASGACYYAGGGCNVGSLAANTWTPWTGYWTATRSWLMPHQTVVNSAWLQIKLTDGTVGGWQSGGAVPIIYAIGYTSRSVQHRCQHGGPVSQNVRCGFNDNP